MLITSIIDIHNGVSFGYNGHILVQTVHMETSVSFIHTINNGIPVVSCACRGNRANGSIHIVCQRYRFFKVIGVPSGNILFPYNHRISCRRFRCPFSKDCSTFGNGMAELKLIARTCGIGVPSTEGVTITFHIRFLSQLRAISILTAQHKLGSVVGGALTVLVKHQPVAFGGIHAKHHIAANHNGGIVSIKSAILMTCNIRATVVHLPAQENVFHIARGIGHIHGIRGRSFRTGHWDQHIVGTNGRCAVIYIGYQEGTEGHGVEV